MRRPAEGRRFATTRIPRGVCVYLIFVRQTPKEQTRANEYGGLH